MWCNILNDFQVTSKALQSEQINLKTCAVMYESLEKMLSDMRGKFHEFENKVKELLPNVEYSSVTSRIRKRKVQPNDGDAPECTFSPRDNFRVNGFLLIVDTLIHEIKRRGKVYFEVGEQFSFLNDFTLTEKEYREAISTLISFYSDDLEDFYSELKQFHNYVQSKFERNEFTHSQLYEILLNDQLSTVFSNVEIALRIFLTLMITNCSAERSFSQLKRIKVAQRATMGQDRLEMLSLLCIESDILRKIDINEIITDFSERKCRKNIF